MKITVHDEEVTRMLEGAARKIENLRPAMTQVGEIVRTSIERNFRAEGRPIRWKRSRRAKREGGQTLSDSSILRNSFTVKAGDRSVSVGTVVPYAGVHQGRSPRVRGKQKHSKRRRT